MNIRTFNHLAGLIMIIAIFMAGFWMINTSYTKVDDGQISAEPEKQVSTQDESSPVSGFRMYAGFSISPLTYDKFSAIMNGTDNFSTVLIHYRRRLTADHRQSMSLDSTTESWTSSIATIDDYYGNMVEYIRTGGSPVRQMNKYKKYFTATEVQAIYDYLGNNAGYFFNNEEFDGKYPPPVASFNALPATLCLSKYVFTLSFMEPGDHNANGWAIRKCVDEYPVPDHPLYELFEMLENDFKSQLEYDHDYPYPY